MIPFFHIVIVAYNNGPELQNTLNALSLQEETNFSAIVLNNNCPSQSTAALRLPDSRFKLMHSLKNLGFSGGCNLASKDAKAPWLIMLNPDAQPAKNWLKEIKVGINKYDANMFGSTQIMGNKGNLIDGLGDVWSIFGYCWRGGYGQSIEKIPKEDRQILTPCAAASIYNRMFFEKLGGFDEKYFCYLEDVDLGLRMRAIGSECVHLCNAIVFHIGGASQEGQSDFALMQSTKNTARLIIKNAPIVLLPIMLILFILSQFWFLLKSKRSPQRLKRWKALRLGLNSTRQHFNSRRKTQKNTHSQIFNFLDFGLKSLRTLPVQSRPISTKTHKEN